MEIKGKLVNPFILEETEEAKKEIEDKAERPPEKELVNPFVFGKKTPDQKDFLLLLTENLDGEDEPVRSWHIIAGRYRAREFLIGKIKEGTLDVFASFILVSDAKLKLLNDAGTSIDMPTVYQIFTDPRSSWTTTDFGDDFNIEDYVEAPSSEDTDSNLSAVAKYDPGYLRDVNSNQYQDQMLMYAELHQNQPGLKNLMMNLVHSDTGEDV